VRGERNALRKAPSLRVRLSVAAGGWCIWYYCRLAINLIFDTVSKVADLSYDRLLRALLLQMDENVCLIRNEGVIDIRGRAFATLAQAEEDRVFISRKFRAGVLLLVIKTLIACRLNTVA